MTGGVSPACAATSVKWAGNGIPEGLPRGSGFTLRGRYALTKASVDAAAIHKKSRREMWFLDSLMGWRSVNLSCNNCSLRVPAHCCGDESTSPETFWISESSFCCAVL